MRSVFLSMLFLLIQGLLLGCLNRDRLILEVRAGEFDRQDTPLWVELPEGWKEQPFFWLRNDETEHYVPVQKAKDGRIAFLLDEPLNAGESRRYRLTTVRSDPQKDRVRVIQDSGQLKVQIEETPVLTYHCAPVAPPPGEPGYYTRSGFIHPLYTPSGQVISEGFPKGHMHQHGVFFAWVKTHFEGRELDFWNQHKQLADVRHEEVIEKEGGDVFGRFIVRILHKEIMEEGELRNVLNETWVVTVYRLQNYFMLDLRSIQTPSGITPLEIDAYHYGGLGFRATSQWMDESYDPERDPPANSLGTGQGGFLTSEGQGRIAGNHSRPNWVDMSGQIDGVPNGIAIMGHPDNFRFPQPVRLHPAMPYFCFAPSVLGAFSLQPGERYESDYRFYIHQGEADTASINSVWRDYVNPPEVVVGME